MEKYIRYADVEAILSVTPGCGYALSAVRDLKPCDVAPVLRGQWIIIEVFDALTGGMVKKAFCTNCGIHNKMYKPPFCPHCGATMSEKEKGA